MKASELTNKKTPEVYLDLDGVVADFFDRYAELAIIRLMMEKYNKSEAEAREVYHKNEELWRTEFGIRSYRDIPPAKGDPVLNMMIGTDFFNRLPKFASADTLVSYLVKTFGSYKVLSSPLRNDYENSEKWKKVWVERELNPPPTQVIIEHKKEKYAKQPDGTPNILIDDRGNNITNWEAKGGIGIKYQADENGLDVVYKGVERAFKIINGEEEHVPQVLKSIDRTQTIATASDQLPQTVKESVENKEEFLEMFRKFFSLAIDLLKLKSLPKMKFEYSVDDEHQPTFGKFDHHNGELTVALGNRHPNDILRTLAHELVHYKQGTQHRLDDRSGETGSEEENEANAVAGIIMRYFNKKYPEYLKLKPVMLGLREDSVNEIDYADALDSGAISPNGLMKSGRVIGNIEGNDIVMVSKGNQTVYILKVDNQAAAVIGFDGKNLKNIKNFSQTTGVIRALIGFLVHKKNMKILISPNEPLTFDGLKWLINLIKNPRGLEIKDQAGKDIDPEQFEKEWKTSKKTGIPGATGITISENIQFGNKIRENEARRKAGSLLMPFNFYSIKFQKQNTTEGRRKKKKKWAAYGPGPYGWYGYDAGYSGDSGIEEMARSRLLSDEQVKEIAEFWASGKTLSELARMYKVDINTIKKNILRAFGEKKYDELEQQHLANTKFPEQGRSKEITPDQVQQMAKLFASGITPAEIGRKFGISRSSVRVHLNKLPNYNELEQQHLANTKYPEKGRNKEITPEQVKEIYDLYIAGDKTLDAIGAEFGISRSLVTYYASVIAKQLYGPDGFDKVIQIRKANIENRKRLGPTTTRRTDTLVGPSREGPTRKRRGFKGPVSGGSGLAEDNSPWMYGHCHVMALALKSLHPQWQLRAHVGWDEETEEDDDYRVDHIYVVDPATGEAYDCRGKFNSEQELVGTELMATETQMIDYSLEDIKFDVQRGELKPFSKKDLENAKAFIEKNRIVLEGVEHSLPAILYHGGNIPIKKFNVPKHGAYFSPHKKWAKGYGDVITPVKINAKNVYLADYTNDIDEEIADALFDRDYQTVAKFIKLLQAKGYDALQTVTDSEMVVAFPGTEVKVINVEEGLSWSLLGDDLSVQANMRRGRNKNK